MNNNLVNLVAAGILGGAVLAAAFIVAGGVENKNEILTVDDGVDYAEIVAPMKGVELSVAFNDMISRAFAEGVIDREKLKSVHERELGYFNEREMGWLEGEIDNELIVIRPENSRLILNLLWGLGLGNKNQILEEGEMAINSKGVITMGDELMSVAGRYASTGGWQLATGEPMDHYSRHLFLDLNDEEQDLAASVAKGVFRPCCGNSTHFPDCNHGMAMLYLIQMMAKAGMSEQKIYETVLLVNSYWFEDNYSVLAKYFSDLGIDWKEVDPEMVLGREYSSANGFNYIASQVDTDKFRGGGSSC